MAFAAALLLVSVADGPLAARSIAINHTASVLVEKAPALGIDFDPNNEKTPRPDAADVKAHDRADTRVWLEAQILVPDDSIREPPDALRTFLDDRREALEAIVEALETDAPRWREVQDEVPAVPDLLPSLRLHRVLLASALAATRRGDLVEAERFVEASWSLGRQNEESSLFIRRLIAVAAGRWQTGVLRKLRSVPPVWIDRLGETKPWEAMLDAYALEMTPKEMSLQPSDPWDEVYKRAPGALVAGLKKLGPCTGSSLDDDGLWKLVERELSIRSDETALQLRSTYREIALPNMKNAFQRAGRLAVDQELALEILRLRQSKEQDPEKRWPARMANPTSTVCPAFGYAYRSDDSGMEIRFEGTLVDPVMPLILPLTFRSAYPKPPPPPADASPPLTPTPAGGMIAPQ